MDRRPSRAGAVRTAAAANAGLRDGNKQGNRKAAAQANAATAAALKRKAAAAAGDPEVGGKGAAKRRAALGEITNAFVETKSQAKKGLSKIISKGKSQLQPPPAPKQPQLSRQESSGSNASTTATSTGRRRSSRLSSASLAAGEESLEISGQTRSLPSSQEVLFKDVEEVPLSEGEEDSRAEEDQHSEPIPAEIDTERRGPPPGVVDFDAANADDHNQVSDYVMDVFQYYKNREIQFRVPDYMRSGKQPDLTTSMRGILVDWLVEVQESFELNHETLYTAVRLMDLYLSKVTVKKEDLQLVGATACLIACKIDERIPPVLDDFVYVCDDAYNKDQLKAKEREMIEVTGYDFGFPLSYRYLRRYGRVCQVAMPVLTLGRFILEMALMEYSLNVHTSESLLAAAALLLTFRIKGIDVEAWRRTLEYYSGHAVDDCRDLFHRLHKMLLKPQHEVRGRTIRTKYEHEVFHQVAKIPIPREINL